MIIASGPNVALQRAHPHDAVRAYRWLVESNLTPAWIGPPWFQDRPAPTHDQFRRAYPKHYFDGSRPFDGRALVISAEGMDVGLLVWHRVDLLRDLVELELWLADGRFGRRGYGSEALRLACTWLQAQYGVNRFLLRPSRRNVHGLRCARRAGFRETDLDGQDLQQRLDLPAAPYRDAVLLFHVMPVTWLLPVAQEDEAWVFFDTEFSSLQAPVLMSIGAISSDDRRFYAELEVPDGTAMSRFVQETVLPLMEGEATPRARVAERWIQWLRGSWGGRPLRLISDSGFDRWALTDLMESEDLPAQILWQRAPVAYAELDRLCEELKLRRHHALDDAMALRAAVLGSPALTPSLPPLAGEGRPAVSGAEVTSVTPERPSPTRSVGEGRG